MFSSLPSASKIYVNSSKSRQSAKKKRKKPAANVCIPVHLQDEETLVSSTSLRDCSVNQLLLVAQEESRSKELNSEFADEISNSSCHSNQNLARDFKNMTIVTCNQTEHKSATVTNETSKSSSLCSVRTEKIETDGQETKTVSKTTEEFNLTNVNSDSTYCDESLNIKTHVPKETQTFQQEQNFDVESTKINQEIATPDSKVLEMGENAQLINDNVSEVTSSLPVIHLTTEDSVILKTEISESFCTPNNDSDLFSEITNEDNLILDTVCNENLNTKTVQCSKKELSSVFPPSESVKSNHDKLCVTDERKNFLGDNIAPDLDSTSMRSDCCPSTNLYDIHVINSEPSSIDENQMSSGEDVRMPSPDQSETSCTESIMYDTRYSCQNETIHKHCLSLEGNLNTKSAFLKSSTEAFSNRSNESKKVSKSSQNLTDAKISTSNLSRSYSFPGDISKLKDNNICKGTCFSQKSNLDKFTALSSKVYYTSDKSTFTVDKSVIMSNKSTTTSDTGSSFSSKKDDCPTPARNDIKPESENKSSTSFKDSSMVIMKVLPPVAIMQARARSYVFGSIGPTGSLLGNDELSRFFPDNKITIFVGTWNMNGRDPPESVDDFLLPLNITSLPDVYAIGIQESMQSRSEWEILLQTTLGPSHVLFASTSFGVLHLCIFMRRDLIWFCSEPEEANTATRPGSMIKTKGAVAICFMFFGTSFLFVNSHLTAHEQKMKERLCDYEKICSALDLPKQIPLKPHQKGKDVTSRFDCVFWCGDLNFRVVHDRPSVLSFVEEKIRRQLHSCDALMKHDQLTQAMAEGTAFHGFDEGVINFIPSYKFDVGTSCFDSSTQRVPSYTDRILYRSRDKSSVHCVHYDAVPEIFTSDHKPVFAVFKVSLKPGRDNIPLAAGLFKRDIYLEAIKRRARQLEITRNHKQSTICSIM